MNKPITLACVGILLTACARMVPEPAEPSAGHLKHEPAKVGNIPELVTETPYLPPPEPVPETERYTVVVSDVPIRELLFALARDAEINVDIYPGIEGLVTLNAVDQTLPQILNRLSNQVDIRYSFEDDILVVEPDTPYFRRYKVDYVNLARDTGNTVNIATQIDTTSGSVATGGSGSSGSGSSGSGGNNNSTTKVTSESRNRFWETLTRNLATIIGDPINSSGDELGTENIVINAETGVINVNATAKQHQKIQEFMDQVLDSARRQVLVEATIIEVQLGDQYQAGIDWSLLASNAAGLSFVTGVTNTLAAGASGAPAVLQYLNDTNDGNIDVAVNLLETFGDTKVLSSPKMMVLNNQTAILKVVENFVYFEVDVEPCSTSVVGGNCEPAVDTTAKTVPVGLVMSVTPQIGDQDEVILNVRPTITSRVRDVVDPNPELTLENLIPVIRVREMESVLKVNSGDTAVLGGLMEDSVDSEKRGVPVFSDIPGVGELFDADTLTTQKKELVIFLRPSVIRKANLQDDLRSFSPWLSETSAQAQ